jgi:hypothetical protein
LHQYGIPDEVLTDNGKQFTGRFTKPRPAEVMFERICRENGVIGRNTKPRTPTTTGKVERFHQTLQGELLNHVEVWADLQTAQAALDTFRAEYNSNRPHQSLDMDFPADRFTPRPIDQRLPLSPNGGEPVTLAVEVDRTVPGSGNLTVCGQQFWIGPDRAGQPVTLWADTTVVHLLSHNARLKTVPSRLTTAHLQHLLTDGGRPAGPSPLDGSGVPPRALSKWIG